MNDSVSGTDVKMLIIRKLIRQLHTFMSLEVASRRVPLSIPLPVMILKIRNCSVIYVISKPHPNRKCFIISNFESDSSKDAKPESIIKAFFVAETVGLGQ